MGVVRDTADRLVRSFTGVFTFDVDPALDEQENVERVVAETGVVAGVISCLQPIPLADIVVLAPLHVKMTLQIGRIKGFEVSQERAVEIVREVLAAAWLALASQAVIGVIGKLIPPARAVFNFTLNYAATWAIGSVVAYYFDCLREGTSPSADVMKELFAEELRAGKTHGAAAGGDALQARAEALRERVRRRDPALVTKTRLVPRLEALAPPRPPASDEAAPAASEPAPRLKIRITRAQLAPPAPPQQDEPAAPERPAKTLGHEGEAPREVAIGFKNPPKTLGEETPSARERDRAQAVAALEAPAAEGPEDGLVERLERLAALLRAGALSADEFARAKQRLLAEGPDA